MDKNNRKWFALTLRRDGKKLSEIAEIIKSAYNLHQYTDKQASRDILLALRIEDEVLHNRGVNDIECIQEKLLSLYAA